MDRAAIETVLGVKIQDKDFVNECSRLAFMANHYHECQRCADKECNHQMWPNVGYLASGELVIGWIKCNPGDLDRNKKRMEELMSSAKMPASLRSMTFQSFDYGSGTKAAYDKVREIAEDSKNRRGIVLMGATGVGKTHLACGLVNRRLSQGILCLFVVVPELLTELRAGFQKGTTEQILKEVMDIPVLVLDDLASEKTSDWTLEQLYLIINARHLNNRQTVITTNCQTPAEFHERLICGDQNMGKRLMSRLSAMCDFMVIRGTDRRLGR